MHHHSSLPSTQAGLRGWLPLRNAPLRLSAKILVPPLNWPAGGQPAAHTTAPSHHLVVRHSWTQGLRDGRRRLCRYATHGPEGRRTAGAASADTPLVDPRVAGRQAPLAIRHSWTRGLRDGGRRLCQIRHSWTRGLRDGGRRLCQIRHSWTRGSQDGRRRLCRYATRGSESRRTAGAAFRIWGPHHQINLEELAQPWARSRGKINIAAPV